MRKITVPTVVTNGHFDKNKTLSELKRCGAERIALAIDRELDYEFSSQENLELLRELIKYYEDNGLETIVWIGETCGHAGGPAEENPKYTQVRTIQNGNTKPFCVMDEEFIAAFCKWVQNIAKIGAKMIMLDDDLRYGYKGLGNGCCCKNHMAALESELGEEIKETELGEKVFSGGKSKYREAWLKVQGDGMRNFARRLREALDEINPNVRLSFCCSPVSWDPEGYNAIEISEIMAGKTEPFMRITGAPYWVNEWDRSYFGDKYLGEVIEQARMQIDWCRERNIELMTEGDTYPRPRFTTPAAHLECFDMALCASDENVGILKYMLDYVADADYETGYIDAMVQNKNNYEWIEKHFSGKKCVGVNPYNKMRKSEETPVNFDDFESVRAYDNSLYAPACRFSALNTLPTAYGGDGVKIIFGENGRYVTQQELDSGAIIDITAAKYLTERGIDVGITNFGENINTVQNGITDTVNYYETKTGGYTRIQCPVKRICTELSEKADVLIEFVWDDDRSVACHAYENENNQRFLVLHLEAEREQGNYGVFDNYALRRMINENLQWLGKKSVPVLFDTDAPQGYMVVKKDNSTVTVGFWNMYPDKINNAKFKVGIPFKNVTFFGCDGHTDNGNVVLDTIVYPYEFAAFELEL